ncbi:hypothetical protein KUTeg_014942 [Tegillarca granosa]|uniref:BPTI/Kunitz inhibitor domain-containing protein n=1 Tax=Tegillarca granosa TaxID=220873 RepID=A0ABQ9ENN8_TEGGR|nr:hypothetical protein KUTeg_014942 [Tegillarca granosa]
MCQVVQGNTLTFGKHVERQCLENGKKCDPEYRCAIQHLQWPMNMSFPVCVPRKHFPVKMHICELPPEAGNCGARFMRWYYNRFSRKCTLFKYQGCNGNMNNFKTRAECQASCYHRNTLQNDAYHDPRALAVSRPQIVSEPEYITGYNQVSTRSRKESNRERDRTKKTKRLKKLRRRRKRKGLLNKKRRREGKNTRDRRGKKRRHRKRNKKNKKRKNRKKKNKKRKNQRQKEFEVTEGGTDFHNEKKFTPSTITVIPQIKKKQYHEDEIKKNQLEDKSEKNHKKGMTLLSILDPKTPTPTTPSIIQR